MKSSKLKLNLNSKFVRIGLILFAAGFVIMAAAMLLSHDSSNKIEYKSSVQAKITSLEDRVHTETTVHSRKNRRINSGVGRTVHDYIVSFEVLEGDKTYYVTQQIPRNTYDEYLSLEQNTPITFNLYLNPDGKEYLTLKEGAAAAEEYGNSGTITNTTVFFSAFGLITAFVGLGMICSSDSKHKK